MNLLRRIWKITLWTMLGLVVLFLSAALALRHPAVQTWVTGKTAAFLSEKWRTDVSVQRVDIRFFKTALLEGLYVADQQGDTLLYAQRLYADIGLFAPFRSDIYLNKVSLQGAVLNLHRAAGADDFNYAFITGEPDTETSPSSGPGWTFGARELLLEEVRFNMRDEGEGRFHLTANIGQLNVTAETLDFVKQEIALEGILVKNSEVAYRQLEGDGKPGIQTPTTPTPPGDLTFPSIGWTLSAGRVSLENNRIAYHDNKVPRIQGALDFNHLDLWLKTFEVRGLRYADDGIRAAIEQLAFRDEGGFQLDSLSVGVQVLPREIAVKNLLFRTPESFLQNDTRLVFNEFGDLADFMKKVNLQSNFAECRLATNDLLLLAPALRNIESLHFPARETFWLDGKLVLANNRLALQNLRFSAGNVAKLRADGSIADLTGTPRFDLQIAELSTSYQGLKTFTRNIALPAGLKNLGQTTLSGHLKGTLADLVATGFVLSTQSSVRFAGDLHARNLPDMDQAFFDLDIKNLTARATDFRDFAEGPLPPQLDSLGLAQFAGHFKGTARDFNLDGHFHTEAGDAETKLSLHFNKDYSFAKYEGQLALEEVALGKVLGDTLLGNLSLRADLTGEGLTREDLDAWLNGRIEKFAYRGYEYHNLRVDGHFVKRLFEGNLRMDDANLGFALTGKINLNDSLPDLDLVLAIDTVHFKNLKLTEQDLGLSGRLQAKLTGNSLDNLTGLATYSNLNLTGNGAHYFDEKIELEARQLGAGRRALRFDAGFLKARIEGLFHFSDLPGLLTDYVNDFFPMDGHAPAAPDTALAPALPMADQQFEFDVRFANMAALAGVFLPGFSEMDTTAYLTGRFDSAEKQLEMTGAFSNIGYQGTRFDSLLVSMSGNRRRLKSSVQVRNLDLGGTLHAPLLTFDTRLAADTLRFDAAMLDDSLGTLFKWGGRSTETPKDYKLTFDPVMLLNHETWAVDEKNAVHFTLEAATVSDLVFSKDNQSVGLQSLGEAPPGDLAPLEVWFKNFSLGEISGLLNNPDLRLEGVLDGSLLVVEPLKNLHYEADVQARALALNGQPVGDLSVGAAQPAGAQVLEISTALTGANELDVSGTYDLQAHSFDLRAGIGKLAMSLAEPFLSELIRKSEGYISGNFNLKGTAEQPAFTGSLTTHGVSTEVALSGTRYRTDGGTIVFSENAIELGPLDLFDANGRKAMLGGRVGHTYFNDLRLDLRAQAEGLQILNTARTDNALYYGQLFANADVSITGTAEKPRLDITAATSGNSRLFVEPLTADLAVVQEDYIIFANPNNYAPDSLALLVRRARGQGGLDLRLVLEVNPQTRLNIIIDPLTGDELTCTGTGNFIVSMNSAGDLDITGTYIIEEGSYSFNYEGLVKRRFDLRKGSSLTFSGDPYQARFDITAVYKTRATTYELIGNEATLTDAVLAASKRRSDVEVLMKIAGGLDAPDITFDLALPSSEGGLVDNIKARKLADLRDDPTELNKQVFGLLFFNSFIQQEAGASLAGAGENAALKSVSGLISNQLNRLADRFVKGVDLTLGVDSYRAAGQADATVTEVQAALSKQLFNERLTIRVGGQFNLENSGQSSLQQGGQSAIAGDFVLEYKLDPQGHYLLKVFHKTDYNALLDANTNRTGVGVMYRKSY